MKNILTVIFLCFILFVGCKEDYIGQFPVDDIAPKQIAGVQVENLAGMAKLSYNLPNEPDMLYVKAVYVNEKGEQKEVLSSVFSNTMEIRGFGRSKKVPIKLISVDRSQNESAPVMVEIEPLDSPIYAILETVDINESWGGIKINWENPMQEQVIVSVVAEQDTGTFELDTYYSTEKIVKQGIRGLDTVQYNVALSIRDVYGNSTDTVRKTVVPLFEMMLPCKTEAKEMPLATGYKLSQWGQGFAGLFDGKKNDDRSLYYLDPGGAPNPYFTIDLGGTYILSRIKEWQRTRFMYALHNLRFFEMWGTTELANAQDPDNWDGWELLATFESYKPSGNPPGGTITAEDNQHALDGEDFEFENPTSPVRYIRIRSVENWTKSNGICIGELEIYGKKVQ